MQFITNINPPHVSTPSCHLKVVFQIKGIQVQRFNLGMFRIRWNY